jgi:hypothetical protein
MLIAKYGNRHAPIEKAAVPAHGRRRRWRLVFDTDTHRLFVEHEKKRGDMRGSGYGTNTDEMDVAAFLNERGQGQHELMQLLGTVFEDRQDAPRP